MDTNGKNSFSMPDKLHFGYLVAQKKDLKHSFYFHNIRVDSVDQRVKTVTFIDPPRRTNVSSSQRLHCHQICVTPSILADIFNIKAIMLAYTSICYIQSLKPSNV